MANSPISFRFGSIVFFIGLNVLNVIGSHPELKLVNVVFRHGDRAPDNNGLEMYPNDPYLSYSFYPMGLGGLTNAGKRREFGLGKFLRNRYNDFLNPIYLPGLVEARSTDYDRTKMSLQLVMAGLFPPAPVQKWNQHLDWQPITFSYRPSNEDVLFVPEDCPKYIEEHKRVLRSDEVKKKIAMFDDLMKFVTKNSGRTMNTTTDMYYLYHTFVAESSMDLPLPEWAMKIFPYGELLNATNLEYDILSYNDKLKRLNGGMFVRKISEDMSRLQRGTHERGRKMYLYSGHETNIAAFQQALGVYVPHVPEYSSGVIIELYEKSGEYLVKVVSYLGIPPAVVTLAIPGCSEMCPLEKFIELLSDRIPRDEDLDCVKPNTTPPQNVLGR